MSERNQVQRALARMGAPDVTAAELAAIAQQFPELRAHVVAHPTTDARLRSWLHALGGAAPSDQDPHGQTPYGQTPYGQPPHPSSPYGAPSASPGLHAPATPPPGRRSRAGTWVAVMASTVAVLSVVALVVVLLRGPSDAGVDGDPTTSEPDQQEAGSQLEPGVVPVGTEGAGSRTDGVAVLTVYFDFACFHCASFSDSHIELIRSSTASGTLTVEYHPVVFLDAGTGTGFSTRAATAAVAVADQAPDLFVDMIDAVFTATDGGITPLDDREIAETARKAGVPQSVIDTFGDDAYVEWVEESTRLAQEAGVHQTPWIEIDGERFQDWSTPGALADALGESAR